MLSPNLPTVCFPVRFPEDKDLQDGFYQRVKAIDDLLAEYANRIYIRTDGSAKQFFSKSRVIKERCVELKISRRYPWQVQKSKSLVRGNIGYLHSILSLESEVSQRIFESCFSIILDIHGAVPEEAQMMGVESIRIDRLKTLERAIVERAKLVVGVSKALMHHVAKNENRAEKILLPVADIDVLRSELRKKEPDLVIYAGGVQAWQQLEKMLAFVQAHPELRFVFLSRDGDVIRSHYREQYGVDFPGEVFAVPPIELGKWYEKASFGLILRADSVVNRVASPTKMMEYLKWGVIPILDFGEIGDFRDLGMLGVNWLDDLPGEDEKSKILKRNFEVLGSIQFRYKSGAEELISWIQKTDSNLR